jgi:hypothetical protein
VHNQPIYLPCIYQTLRPSWMLWQTKATASGRPDHCCLWTDGSLVGSRVERSGMEKAGWVFVRPAHREGEVRMTQSIIPCCAPISILGVHLSIGLSTLLSMRSNNAQKRSDSFFFIKQKLTADLPGAVSRSHFPPLLCPRYRQGKGHGSLPSRSDVEPVFILPTEHRTVQQPPSI